MRVARVPAEGLELAALLFEGSFYRVDMLDELLGSPFSTELGVTAEFHRRVFGLASAGFGSHLESLADGHRAEEARVELGARRQLLPPLGRSPTLLEAPLEGGSALAVRVDGRALLGHEASGLVPDGVGPLRARPALALVLGDDLHKPRPDEAAKAVLGVCPAIAWASLDDERRAVDAGLGPGPGRDVGTHLGPFLTYRQAFEAGLELDLRIACGQQGVKAKRVRLERERYGAILARAARYGDLTAGDALLLTVGQGLEVAAAHEVVLDAGPLGTLSGRLGGLPKRLPPFSPRPPPFIKMGAAGPFKGPPRGCSNEQRSLCREPGRALRGSERSHLSVSKVNGSALCFLKEGRAVDKGASIVACGEIVIRFRPPRHALPSPRSITRGGAMATYSAFVRTVSLWPLAALALVAGCEAGSGEGGPGERVADTSGAALSYEEFKAARFFRDPTDPGVLLFHGDVAVEVDSPAMRSLYEGEAGGHRLIVNQVGGVDDKWSASVARNLTYCVSNNFGTKKNSVVSAMNAAAAAWEGIANVNFFYQSVHDANCNASNASVVFDVRQEELGAGVYARAFFPSTGRAGRSLIIDTDAFGAIAPWTLAGVLRHELGHALGFRHEHIRPEAGGACTENNAWRALTSYDSFSVMHYPQCNGNNEGDLVLTSRDASGAGLLYPF